MHLRNNQITVREILENPAARKLLQQQFPKEYARWFGSPVLHMAQNMTLQQVIQLTKGHIPAQKMQSVLEKLAAI